MFIVGWSAVLFVFDRPIRDRLIRINQNSFGGTIQILILAMAHAPKKGAQADQAHQESDWNQPDQNVQVGHLKTTIPPIPRDMHARSHAREEGTQR